MLTGKAKTDYQREYMRKYRKTHTQKRRSKTQSNTESKTQAISSILKRDASLAFNKRELTYERDDYAQ